MIVKELFAKLGLDVDADSFLKASIMLNGVSSAVQLLGKAYEDLIAPMLDAVKETANMGFEVAKTAQRVGVSTDALQELRFAAKAAGLDVESMQHGLTILARTAYAAAQGSGEAVLTFRKIGVAVKDASGHLRPADDVLGDVAEKFARMPDGMNKTALAMHVFGRSGAELIPFLNQGREGVAGLREEAHRFGVVLDKDAIERSREYIKVNREMGEAFEGLKIALIEPLIRASPIKKAITEWIVENRKFIAQKFHQVLRAVWEALKVVGVVIVGVWRIVKLFGLAIREAIALLTPFAGAFAVVAGAIGLATGALWLFEGTNLAVAATALGAWLAAAAPWVLLAVLVGAVALLLNDLYVTINGGDSLITRHTRAWLNFFDYFLGGFADLKKTIDVVTNAVDYLLKKLAAFPTIFTAAQLTGKMLFGVDIGDGIKDPASAKAAFGGGAGGADWANIAGPRAGAAVSSSLVIPNITVHVPAGSDGTQIGNDIWRAIDEAHDRRIREAAAAVR